MVAIVWYAGYPWDRPPFLVIPDLDFDPVLRSRLLHYSPAIAVDGMITRTILSVFVDYGSVRRRGKLFQFLGVNDYIK